MLYVKDEDGGLHFVGTRHPFPVRGKPGDHLTNALGMVLRTQTRAGPQQYVVSPGQVQPVSDSTARLLINSPQTGRPGMHGEPKAVDSQSSTPSAEVFGDRYDWPTERAEQVNSASGGGSRDTVRSVLRKVDDKGRSTLSTWAGTSYPAEITADRRRHQHVRDPGFGPPVHPVPRTAVAPRRLAVPRHQQGTALHGVVQRRQ